jgi:predicted  nucleic acid-binding Zn-ribbon protein
VSSSVLSLRGVAYEERANDLEKKLKVSKKACKKAENEVVDVEDLRQRLQAAEDSLSKKEAKLVQCENDIIALFETQTSRFSSNTISSFVILLAFSR